MNQVKDGQRPNSRIEPDFFPPGTRVCFICLSSSDLIQDLQTVFEDHGYLTTATCDVETARQKLRLNRYQAVAIEAGHDFRDLFLEISSWPGRIRRETNLMVLGRKAPSLHQQMPFIMGANFYLNINDMPRMKDLITQAVEGYQKYYQPWREAREAVDAG